MIVNFMNLYDSPCCYATTGLLDKISNDHHDVALSVAKIHSAGNLIYHREDTIKHLNTKQ